MTNVIKAIFIFIITFFIIAIFIAYPFMWLWNWLMPVIFGLTKLTFWQSLGLLFLSSMLFKTPNTNK